MFGIGQLPTGDKDPFGLRRAALGVMRILIEKRLALPLSGAASTLAFAAFDSVAAQRSRARASVLDFLYERLRGYLRDQGYTANQVDAVLDASARHASTIVPDAARGGARVRGAARSRRRSPPPTSASSTSCARAAGEAAAAVDRALLADGAEHDLYAAFETARAGRRRARCASGDYTGALQALAVGQARRSTASSTT